jgi:hypothetical protein
MDRYIKQIQTRMNRQLNSRGQSVTKQQVRDVYSQVVKNPDKPTDIEMSRVIELLAKQLSSLRDASRTQEKVIEDGQLTVSQNTENQESATIEITQENNPDLWETLQPPTEQPQQPQELALPRSESTLPTPLSGISQAQSEEAASLAISKSSSNLPTHQPEAAEATGITQTEIEQAVELAIAQTGETGNTEAKLLMTQLALHLTSDINTLSQAVTALVTGYLNKRSNILKNAFLTLNTLRNAQTNSFCSGLTPDFLAKQETAKKQLMEIANTFN